MQVKESEWKFVCNICGASNSYAGLVRHRELLPCANCGSCARFRGIAAAVNQHVLGQRAETALAETGLYKELAGIGMSDAECYAAQLKRIFSYINTYYHTDPHLDVSMDESAARYRDLDFVISSDVLEHVVAPVSRALQNICSMLKSGGKFIVSAPYVEGYETIEHFPQLHDFEIVQAGDAYVLVNQRIDGLVEVHRNLCFHGGPGSVLEMRIFGEGDLRGMLAYAGFGTVEILVPTDETIGYCWDDHCEHELAPGRRSKSYVLVCTKL